MILNKKNISRLLWLKTILYCLMIALPGASAQDIPENYLEYKGIVVDASSGNEIAFANLAIQGTNIATVTNSEGRFSLKVPEAMPKAKVEISHPGYQRLLIILSEFQPTSTRIQLQPLATELEEVNITRPKSAESLVRSVFANRDENYFNEEAAMIAFYRESIKKRNRNVSLAEAVVNIKKQPYNSGSKDLAALYKARKSTDYSRLDTIAIKLQGGPLNALYADVIKNPEYFITTESLPLYDFSFDESITDNGKLVYVVNFKQKPSISDPLYYGKLYIHADSRALTNAVYNLNVENRDLATEIFVRRKPARVKVYPVEAAYRVDYREKDGKWFYSYSNVQLEFVVNWKRKLFNSRYRVQSEMLITDWEKGQDPQLVTNQNKYRDSSILADEASGFADPDFWGAFNVIEPEKSIESAIEKIQKQLQKD